MSALKPDIYIVTIEGYKDERFVAELLDVDSDGQENWMQIGVDYDIWQYTDAGSLKVTRLAKIDLTNLTIEVL